MKPERPDLQLIHTLNILQQALFFFDLSVDPRFIGLYPRLHLLCLCSDK